jgi:fructosamine-3-kinase
MKAALNMTMVEPAAEREIGLAERNAIGFLRRFGEEVQVTPVGAHSNFNHVFCCEVGVRRYFLKVAQAVPRRFAGELPRTRIFAEAAALRSFECSAGGLVAVPAVIYEDTASYSILMTDVGRNRVHLIDRMATGYADFALAVLGLGEALGRWHRSTRGSTGPAESDTTAALRRFIYERLIGPGIQSLAGRHATATLVSMQHVRECLIHSDLWGKNLLLGEAGDIAVLDFEGVLPGDPAFDLATLMAVGLLPVFQYGAPADTWAETAERLLLRYRIGLEDDDWCDQVVRRLAPYTAVLAAARVAGPFPYSISEAAKGALGRLCREIIVDGTESWRALVDKVMGCAPCAGIGGEA